MGQSTLCKVPSYFAISLGDIDSGDQKIVEIFEIRFIFKDFDSL